MRCILGDAQHERLVLVHHVLCVAAEGKGADLVIVISADGVVEGEEAHVLLAREVHDHEGGILAANGQHGALWVELGDLRVALRVEQTALFGKLELLLYFIDLEIHSSLL